LVLAVGLGTMMSSLLASLNGRRREMAILRSLGAGPVRLAGLLMIESSLLAATAVGMGVIIRFASFAFLGQWLEREFGFYLTGSFFTVNEYMYMVGIWIIGTGLGLFPAVVSSRRALKDGLTVRV
ncbi:MAG TPA: FtsX-like permease family protein, partial [Pseudobdellovibrionaceae bacterium]|nr:FtsX-like permease family protein [Pseudobdellovibrionaceae bacterium]